MKIIKGYSVFLALMPVISIYASGVPGLNAGDILFVIFAFMAIFSKASGRHSFNRKQSNALLLLVVYIIFSACLASLFQAPTLTHTIDIFVRSIRFTFYVICVVLLSRQYFDFETAANVVVKVSIAATVFMIAQYILYFQFGIILKGFLPFLPVYSSEYVTQNYELMYSIYFYRPTSFFLEPAWYAQYVIVALAILLFRGSIRNKYDISGAIFITLGIILSTSAQGLVFAAFLWMIFGLKLKKRTLKGALLFLMNIILIIFAFSTLYQTDIIQRSLSRINIASETGAYSARFGGFDSFINNVPDNFKAIGLGYGSVPNNVWMSSAAYMLYGAGIIGFLLTCILFYKYYLASKHLASKLICLIFFAMFFGASIFNSYMLVFYFSFIIYEGNRCDECIKTGPKNGGKYFKKVKVDSL